MLRRAHDAPSEPTSRDAERARAQQQLETLLVRQLLKSSGVFGKGNSAEAGFVGDAFVDVIADAVARAGGLHEALPPGRTAERRLVGETALAASFVGGASGHAHANVGIDPEHVDLLDVVGDRGRVSSTFGPRVDPISGTRSFHHGVDVAAARGTPLRSVVDGVVVAAGWQGGYGLIVEIEQADGDRFRFAHADSIAVRVGETVTAGTVLGTVGSTGRSTGSHVHIEARRDGRAIDPLTALLVERPASIPSVPMADAKKVGR